MHNFVNSTRPDDSWASRPVLETTLLGLQPEASCPLASTRNIDKAGGLDSYLKRIEGGKEDSPMAEALRQRIRREVEGRQLALEMAAQVSFRTLNPPPKS